MSLSQSYLVKKRNGSVEQLNLDKLHKMVETACEGITGVSASQIEMHSNLQFFDGITSENIQDILIKSAADLISEDTPNYQYAAGRLKLFALRKEVWRNIDPPHLIDIIEENIKQKLYDKDLLSFYSTEDWNTINGYIKHDRDLEFTYAGIQQVYDKYLVQNRTNGKRFETPQFAYILIAAVLFKNYDKSIRLSYVKKYYDAISLQKINLPTPIIAGVRTPTKQYASCVLIEVDDSLKSIFASQTAVGMYVAQRAGIGLNVGNIRAINSSVKNGEVKHTGLVPMIQAYQATMNAVSQGGIRKGAGNLIYPIWHLEIENLIVLKNNQGSEENRARHLDYTVSISKLFYERYMKDEMITLFSPHDVKELVESFGSPQFDELYLKYENKKGITKKKISARELLNDIFSERAETGRIYILNIDHANSHSSFNSLITMTNLCCEITLKTKPITHEFDNEGEIATCILSAINLGKISSVYDIEELADLIVRSLDAVIDLQDYPFAAAEIPAKARRPIGVGFTNLSYYFAKNKLKWDSNEARKSVHELTESMQYYLLKASNQLAREIGQCEYYEDTKYSQGILPIDTYKKDIDVFANFEYLHDWEALRENIKKHGLRNSTLTAIMPSESSSVVSNSTNGIDPTKAFLTVKDSGSGVLKFLVPGYTKYKNNYELLWEMTSNEPYVAIILCIMMVNLFH
jgi:ribonucleoside-diphosphate reductase alpha chain